MTTMLCTVRDCRSPLAPDSRRFVCARGHSFDVARSGYVNVLQPQDSRSRTPGDTKEAVAARRRFLDRGHVEPLVQAIVAAITPLKPRTVLDVGCGEGHHLEAIRIATGAEAQGLDISVAAIDAAARRHHDCHWVIANADRFLPYADASFDLVTSITARMNATEFARVLQPGGYLFVALPAPDDLLELREVVLGTGLERDRTERTIGTFAESFTLLSQTTARATTTLDRESIIDVMTSSYRGLRTRERERLDAIDQMHVTLSRDLLLFAKG